jgi:hypothetical protein
MPPIDRVDVPAVVTSPVDLAPLCHSSHQQPAYAQSSVGSSTVRREDSSPQRSRRAIVPRTALRRIDRGPMDAFVIAIYFVLATTI